MSNVAKIHGNWQIKPYTIDLEKLNVDFLPTTNWSINGTSPNKYTITTIPDPIDLEDVANKRYVDLQVSGAIVAAGPIVNFYDFQTIGAGITGIMDGINKIFVLANIPDVNSSHIFINGLLQDPTSYTIVTNQITFGSIIELHTDDDLVISYRKTL